MGQQCHGGARSKQPWLCDAEYIALSHASQEAVWLRQLSLDLRCELLKPTVLHEDNQSAIALSKGQQPHGKAKHVDIKFHFIRDQVKKERIEIHYCPSESMIADMLRV